MALIVVAGYGLASVLELDIGSTSPGRPLWSSLFAQDERPQDIEGAEVKRAAENAPPDVGDLPRVYRFDVPLPISGKPVIRRVERVLRSLPRDHLKGAPGTPRPVLLFEFRPADPTAAEGSKFGDCVDLARYISGDSMSQVRTVAWVRGSVKGHAVLPVLACEQIVMSKDAELGAAGINETTIDDTLRGPYTDISQRRKAVPLAVALGLLDKDLAVHKVTLLGGKGVRYATAAELNALREEGAVSAEETLFQPGDHHVLSAQAMRMAGFASHLADDTRGLATQLRIPLAALLREAAPEEGWRGIRVDLHGPVHRQAVSWIQRSIKDYQQRSDFNLLVLSIQSGGGDLEQSRQLASFLAELSKTVHTAAYVGREARSDAALIALACDELVMAPSARLGGAGESEPSRTDLDALRQAVPEIFEPLARDWSLPLALVDRNLEVYRHRHVLSGDVRYLSAEEAQGLPDRDQWQRDNRPIATSGGLSGLEAEELGLARATAQSFDQFKSLYQLESDLTPVRPNWAMGLVEWLSDPRIAGVLLFVGWFALMFEMSTPGIGVPGFVAVMCFLLYFWSQFLHGTAGWLEVLLFVGGLVCLAIEIFALPGFGVFGIGGALMVIVSIVLASQTFVVPMNAYQLRQFPVSLLMVAAGMGGGIASIYFIRRFLPDTPYFNRMLLAPPPPEEREALSRREALVAWDHLLGKRGMTMTPLVPAGKVQFGDELVDCVSNGELIAKGTPVVVEEVAGNRVVVRKVNL